MNDSIILNTPVILIITVIAIIMTAAGRFIVNRYVRGGLYIASFLCVIGCVTYALLLGVELNELLSYVLLFTLAGLTAFIPSAQPNVPQSAPKETEEQTETVNTEGKDEL